MSNSDNSGLSGGQSSGASVEFVNFGGVLCRYVDSEQVVVHTVVANCVPGIGDGVDIGGSSYRVRHRSWSFAPCGAVVCTIELYRLDK